MAPSPPSKHSVDGKKKEGEGDEDPEIEDVLHKTGWKALFCFTTRQHLPFLLLALLWTFLAALTLPAQSIVYGLLFNQFAKFGAGKVDPDAFRHNISKYCFYAIGNAGINWATNSLYMIFMMAFGELQAKSARDRVFDALLKKKIEWYDTRKSGIAAFLPSIQMSIRDLQLATSGPLGEGVQSLCMAGGAIGVAFYYAWDLTLVVISTVPLVYLMMHLISSKLSRKAHEQAESLQHALKYLTNAIQSIEMVKCFNGQTIELRKYATAIARAATLYHNQANLRGIQLGFMQFITVSMFVQGFWYGSHLVGTGKRSPGAVITSFWGALLAVQGITGFLPQFIIVQKGRVAAARLLSVLDRAEDGQDKSVEPQGGERPLRLAGDIRFKQVNFSYPALPDQPALRDATVFFPAGETTFIIGRSGSGKSTLGQLLVRFYEPTSGEITVDGMPLSSLDGIWLRENITFVEQHSVLFNDTIYRNIALAKCRDGNVTLDDVEKAAEFALLEQMVANLPKGYNTMVGAKGDSMSGGQKQRMALARARLRDTQVLVLDESTSALDYITRSAVLEAIRKWRKGKTTVIVTHDISQILPDDFLYLLDRSRVVAEGYRKDMEADQSSAFQSFLVEPPEAGGRKSEEDDGLTDELLSLYDASWSSPSPRPKSRPVSALFFDESLLSPYISNRRESMMPSVGSPFARLSAALEHNTTLHGRSSMYTVTPSVYSSDMSRRSSVYSDNVVRMSMAKPPPGSIQSRDIRARPTSIRRPLSSARPLSMQRPVSPCSRLESHVSFVETATPGHEHSATTLTRGKKKPRRLSIVEAKAAAGETLTIVQVLRTVWSRLPYSARPALLTACGCAFAHAACTPSFAYVMGKLLATLYGGANQSHLALIYALAILGIAAVDGIVSYGFHFLFDFVAQIWLNEIKAEALKRILDQPREFFDREENSVARLVECLDGFAEEARNLPGRFAGIIFVIITMMTIATVWALVTCWKLTLVAMCWGLVMFAVTKSNTVLCSKWESHCSDANEIVGKVFRETFVNIRTVRCLALEETFRGRFDKATTSSLKVGMKRAIYSGAMFGLNFSAVLFVAAFLFWFGAQVTASGEFETTHVIQTFTLLLMSINYVNFIVNYIPQIGAATDAATRLLTLSNLPLDSHEHEGTAPIPIAEGIALQNVDFVYPTRLDHQILHQVSFVIPPGSCTAIVGASGSGKSTIAALLLKLYQSKSTEGTLTIANRDIDRLHTATLRSHMSIVSQTPVLFPGTIAENITYGLAPNSPYATEASIKAAAIAAGIDEFIDSLPQGYQTAVGEGGTGVSGGQAQRVAIARALIREPDILILDEATSALDVESARIIRDTVLRLVESRKYSIAERTRATGMTVIIITHVREMMAIAERIVMLDQGLVVEEGTYNELSWRNGPFARLLRGVEE